jgi:hypothetical protein
MGLCFAVAEGKQVQAVHHLWGCSIALIAGRDWCQCAEAAMLVAVVAAEAVEGMKGRRSVE